MAGPRQGYQQVLSCSFCGFKSPADDRRLVVGPGGVSICSECLRVCSALVEDDDGDVSTPIDGPGVEP